MASLRKVSACALATTMLFGMGTMMSGCGTKKGNVAVVAASDTWYNTNRIVLNSSYVRTDYEYISASSPIASGDKYVVHYNGLKKLTKGALLDPNFDYNAHLVNDLVEFDQEGNEIQTFHLNEKIAKSKDYVAQITAVVPSEKGVGIYYINQDAKAMSFDIENTYAEVDLSTGELVGEPKVLDFGKQGYVMGVSVAEGYDCVQVGDITGEASASVHFFKGGKEVAVTDFDKDLGKDKVVYIDSMYGNGEGKVIISAYSTEMITVEVDPSTGKAQQSDVDTDFTKKRYTYFDGNEYCLTTDGIKKFNTSTNEEEDFIMFDDCNVNRRETTRGTLLSATETTAILACQGYQTDNYLEDAPMVIYTFEKADKNPNEGKKIIKVASLNSALSYNEAEGIRVFNETNKDCFAKVVTYDVDDYIDGKMDNDNSDEDSIKLGKGKASLGNALAVDLMSGDGPDVILGAADYCELLTEDYLEDLMTYIGGDNGLDLNNYYTNVIDAAKEDGKLYYMPNGFVISGIICDGSDLPADAVGFTFDQYKDFVSGPCNGKEPYTAYNSRLSFFEECLSNSHESLIKDGKVNFDQQEFRDLANFFKDSIPEKAETSDEDIVDTEVRDKANVVTLSSLYDLTFYYYYGDNTKIVGLPSSDGRGPSIYITDSVSISAKSEIKDGAWELIKTMSSEEVLKYSEANPLSKAALDDKLSHAEEFNNNYYNLINDQSEQPISDAELPMYGLYKPGSKVVETYKASVENVSSITTCDNSIMSIVIEEMQPFFEGQKDLDTVIKTIENRAQTVLDERK